MRFIKQDEARRLIGVIREEQRDLASLEKKFDSVRPAWNKAQRLCSQIEAERNGQTATYRRGSTCDSLFTEHAELLTRDLEEACKKRDAIVADLPEQIQQVKTRIFRRLNFLCGPFGGLVSGVTGYRLNGGSRPQCSPELQTQLEAARHAAEGITDPAELLDFIQKTVDRVESEDLQFIPLFRLDQAIEKALGVGETALVV